jgi:hypothetical protein
MDAQTIEIILERVQRIEESIKHIENSNHRQEAILRNIYRELNYIPDVPQAPNLSVMRPTH